MYLAWKKANQKISACGLNGIRALSNSSVRPLGGLDQLSEDTCRHIAARCGLLTSPQSASSNREPNTRADLAESLTGNDEGLSLMRRTKSAMIWWPKSDAYDGLKFCETTFQED